ncbi:farnesyl pyrophosphate synthase-like [Ceratitis capitata]|uniref:Farnesyl pyrophosphate synthase n=1 Tax=Ceratitis capitata TaxID=7213 RepID=A0A811VBQ9_CERCA|nr:farnesyl pyrophosphate synthase-like [Ceratitis capitata]XP_012155817.1 farnesyl pyrophosphate synthase-like [Ceratitis capitata]CAD7013718.1 unnamed protein product [Ceratitis capitata]
MFTRIHKLNQLPSNVSAFLGVNANNTTKNVRSIFRYSFAIKNNEHISVNTAQQQVLKKYQRPFSICRNNYVSVAARATGSKDESKDFLAVFPEIVHELTDAANSLETRQAAEWFTKALEYNVPRGKLNRGILAVSTYKQAAKAEQQTPENLKLAHYLGWCIEMLQSFFLLTDDVMDGSTTRRGQLCWYKLENVGLIALNDALMIENGMYVLFHKHFRHLDCYVDLLDLFHQITFITTMGQSLDILNSNKTVSEFNIDVYNSIVANKSSFYTFYLPVAAALHLAGVTDREVFANCRAIILEMGNFFQIQDDFLDCFGDPEVTGKVGTDIQDNKCSWLAVKCMEQANPEQRAIMEECYGQNDPEKVARVKQLYEELDLASYYAKFQEDKFNQIKTQIEQAHKGVPKAILLQALQKLHQRQS